MGVERLRDRVSVTRRAWVLGLVAGVAVGVVGLGSCARGEPEVLAPTFLPASEEPSPSGETLAVESVEPSVAAPPLPPAATEQTPEGAVAFTQWWFETLNYATATGDTEALRAASDPGCGTCANFIEEIENAYRDGGRIDGGLFSVQVDPAGALEALGVRVPVFADVEATVVKDDGGAVVEEFSAEQTTIVFTALLADGGWVAGGLA